MPDSALALAYPRIANSIVRIVVERQTRTTFGTGFVVGYLESDRRPLVVTAGHVLPRNLKAEDGPTVFRFERRSRTESVIKASSFIAEAGKTTPGVSVVWDTTPKSDIACAILAKSADDGADFLSPDEIGVPCVDDRTTAAPATRVAWAGFPSLLEQPELLGFPQLCYFEGVVSAMIDREDSQRLVIDGHAMPGVSGGPIWFEDDNGRIEVFGLISAYAGYKFPEQFHPDQTDAAQAKRDRMPGFCFAQPLNPVLRGLPKFYGLKVRS